MGDARFYYSLKLCLQQKNESSKLHFNMVVVYLYTSDESGIIKNKIL